jgi:hypothetical protein
MMSAERVKDKKGENINEGDHVYTRYRGGSHEGEVRRSSSTLVSLTKFNRGIPLGRKDCEGSSGSR